MMRTSATVLVAAVTACGGTSGPATDAGPGDAAAVPDAGLVAGSDAGVPDAGGPACTASPPPAPVPCGELEAWGAYLAEQDSADYINIYALPIGADPLAPATRVGAEDGMVTTTEATDWAFSPDGQRLAFRMQLPNNHTHLYVVDLSSGSPSEVDDVSGPFKVNGDVSWFAWSPDSTRLAYVADQAYDARELWVVDATDPGAVAQRASRPLELLGSLYVEGAIPFAWSPDGTRILYRANQDDLDQFDLYVTELGGETPVVTSLTEGIDVMVANQFGWSPDGEAVAFDVSGGDLYVARLCGGEVTGPYQVTDHPVAHRFSADGEKLRFMGDDGDLREVELLPAGISQPVVLVEAPNASPTRLAWSPDGARVAFIAGNHLRLLDGSTGESHRLDVGGLAGAAVSSFVWSPDGASIVYTANSLALSDHELFYVDLSGASPAMQIRISTATEHDVEVADTLRWSLDSTHVAYLADQDQDEVDELFVVEISDGQPAAAIQVSAEFTLAEAPADNDVMDPRWSQDGSRLLYVLQRGWDAEVHLASLDAPGESVVVNGALAGDAAFEPGWGGCVAP